MHRYLLFLVLIAGMFSCVPHKKIIYLQKTADNMSDTITKGPFKYKIHPKDRLYVRVTSYNNEVTEFFNLQSGQGGGGMGGQGGGGRLLRSYYINESGYMEMPLLDSIHVAGLTVQQAQDTIQKAIQEQVRDAFVIVALANYQVTVLGEVGGEGLVTSEQNRMTIFDAIAMSGGLQQFADRKNINIVRKDGENVRFATVDLTDRNIINSEYYYLHPNDIVYVEQLRAKTRITNLRTISSVIGIIVGFLLLERLIPR